MLYEVITGMGVVYRAEDARLGRSVALKFLPLELSKDPGAVERFQREARTAAALEHPNIIPIHRVGESGRVIYFAMKFVSGPSLATSPNEPTPREIRNAPITRTTAEVRW